MKSLRVLGTEAGEPLSVRDLAERMGLDSPVSARDLFGAEPEAAPELRRRAWTNWLGDLRTEGRRARPSNVAEVVGAVQTALREGVRVRAVGSGHSHSKAARPGSGSRNIWLDISRHHGALPHRWLRRDVDDTHLFRVKAGTTIKQLNRSLLPGAGLALPNMGSFDGQTLAGAINTGTHGTGILLATLADLVRSVELVTVRRSATGKPRVELLRVEPSDGITDPVAFATAFPEHRTTLEQDDDLFRSVGVGYGCMGIATSYTLELRDAYWLREDSELIDLRELLALLERPPLRVEGGGEIPEVTMDARHVSALVNVGELQQTDRPVCLLKRHTETPVPSRPRGWTDRWPPERRTKPFQSLGQLLSRPAPDDDRPNVGGMLREHFFEPEANRKPFEHGLDASASYIALRRLREGRGDDQAPKPPPRAISSDFAVPATLTGRALRRVLDVIDRSDGLFATPAGIRFTAPSEHYLAASYGRFTGMVEIPILVEALRQDEVHRRIGLAKEALREIEAALEDELGPAVRPHLGKHTAMGRDDLERRFPRFDRWLASYRRLNAFGLFDNAFTDQFELSR